MDEVDKRDYTKALEYLKEGASIAVIKVGVENLHDSEIPNQVKSQIASKALEEAKELSTVENYIDFVSMSEALKIFQDYGTMIGKNTQPYIQHMLKKSMSNFQNFVNKQIESTKKESDPENGPYLEYLHDAASRITQNIDDADLNVWSQEDKKYVTETVDKVIRSLEETIRRH